MGKEKDGICKKQPKKKKACKTGGKKKGLSLYSCETCGRHSFKAKTVCRPRKAQPAFSCKKCGALGAEKKTLCKPKTVNGQSPHLEPAFL